MNIEEISINSGINTAETCIVNTYQQPDTQHFNSLFMSDTNHAACKILGHIIASTCYERPMS